MRSSAPKVFVSYAHVSEEHKEWVKDLSEFLRKNGIDIILDQFHLFAGMDLPRFMEAHLSSNKNKILCICSQKYVEKANKGSSGVGYEKK